MERTRSLLGISLLFLFTSAILTSCMNCIDGKGPVSIESRSLDSFTELAVNVSADVVIIRGDDIQIEIKAQENLLPILEKLKSSLQQDGRFFL